MNEDSRSGRIEPNQVTNRIGHGKAISPTFRSTRARITRAAFGASQKNGIGQVLRSVIRDRTKPGQTTFTRMPSGASAPRSAAPHAFTHALEAEYAGQDG